MKHGLTVGPSKSLRIWLGANWARLVVGSAILVLPIVGSIFAWRAPNPFAFENRLFALTMTLGPAAIYGFGYFRTFPDALGTGTRLHKDSILQRWSTFARMSSAVAIILTCVCWASIAAKHFRGIVVPLNQTPSFINFFVMGTLSARPDLCLIGAIVAAALMTICMVASERFLVRTMGPLSACSDKSWRGVVLGTVGRCGEWLAKLLRPKATLVMGAVLLLFSLIAPMDPFGGSGLDVVTGQQQWPTAEYTLVGPALMILSEAGRFTYLAALVVAVLAFVSVAMRRHGDRLRKANTLVSISTVIAIFALCDLTLGVARLDSRVPPLLNLVVLGLLCVLPIFVWIKRAHDESARSNRTRIAVMLLYLPLVLAGLALVPLALVLIPGFACFLLGTGFLSLGFLRSRWEATVRPIQIETESKIPQAA